MRYFLTLKNMIKIFPGIQVIRIFKSEISQFSNAQFWLFKLAHLFSMIRVNVVKLQPLRNQRTALLDTLDRLWGTLMVAYRKTLCPGNLNSRFITRFIGMIFYP